MHNRIQLTSSLLSDWQNSINAQPISSLLPYEAYDEETQIYINRQSLGFVMQLSPLVGMEMSTLKLLDSLLEDSLPEGATLQVLLWGSPHIGNYLARWEHHHSTRGDLFEQLAKARVEHFKKGVLEGWNETSVFRLRDFQIYLSVTLPGDDALTKKQLIQLRQQFHTQWQAMGIGAQNIGIEEFLSLLDSIIDPKKTIFPATKIWDPNQRLSTQLGNPETSLSIDDNYLTMNHNWHVHTLSVREWPKQWSPWQMTELLGSLSKAPLQIPCPFFFNVIIHKPSHNALMRKAQVKSLRAEKLASSPLAKLFPRAFTIREDWQHAKMQVEQGARFAEVFFQVVLYANADESDLAVNAVKNVFTSQGWQLYNDTYLQLPLWLSMLPMSVGDAGWKGLRYFNRTKTVMTRNASCLLPLQGEAKGSATPGLLLTGRRGQVAWFDLYDNPEGNYNTAVAGKSGSGKSVLLQELMMSIAGSGGRVFVIDVGRSFEHSAKLLGGDFIAFHPGAPLSLNPFTHIHDFNEALSLLKPLIAVMASSQRNLSDIENALIEQALQAVWQTYGTNSTFTLVTQWLNRHPDTRANDIGTMLFPYTNEGMYGRWFEPPCTLNWDNPIVVLELEELKTKKDLQAVVLLVLLYHINDVMYRGNRLQRIACILDEAWDLLRGEQAGYFMETGCRRARKYRGAFIAGTQSVQDYYQTPAARAVFDNADHVILLSQKNESIEQLQQHGQLQLSAHGFELLKSLKTIKGQYAELLIKNPRGLQLARLCLDPFAQTLYATTAETYSTIQSLLEEGLPLIEAVKQVSQRGGQ